MRDIMPALIRAPLDLLLWLIYLLPWFVLALAGLPICWVLSRREAWMVRRTKYSNDHGVLAWRNRLFWLWGNDSEDGIAPEWWRERVKGDDLRKEVFTWTALRNPVNNLRFVPGIHPVPDPKRVRYIGNVNDCHLALLELRNEGVGLHAPLWCYAWQGAFAGFWIIVPLTRARHFRLRIGWKVLPRDAVDGKVVDYRRFRYPFGVQLTPWRNG